MRETMGGTWVLQLMIIFILMFAAFIILTLNYSKAVKLKNEVIDMIEKYEGLNSQSISLVSGYLLYNGYSATGVCVNDGENSTGVYGADSLSGSTLVDASVGTKYYYCVKKYTGDNNTNYYQVTIFYKFNLPIIGQAGGFSIKGTTGNFYAYDDGYESTTN